MNQASISPPPYQSRKKKYAGRKSQIAVCILLCLLLTGCGTASQPAVTAEPADPVPEARTSYDDSLLSEVKCTGSYIEEGWQEGIAYDYRLPQILDDTPDAEAVNAELRQMGQNAEGGLVMYDRITWESHWNGSLLSLVLTMRETFHYDLGYFTCNYDFALGRSLSNRELLERFQADPEMGESVLRRAAIAKYDQESCALAASCGDCFGDRQSLRAETISAPTTEISRIPLYLDDSGHLHAFGLIGTFAGGGAYYADLLLDLDPDSGISKTAECDFIRAELKNSAVTVTFLDQGLAEDFLPLNEVSFDTPYPVEGLYGDYIDLSVSFLGNGGEAYLFLLDSTGHISFCNLLQSARWGCRFLAVGPLLWPEAVQSLEKIQDPGGFSVEAVTGSGERVDLYDPVSKAQSILFNSHYGSSWYTEDGTHCMNFTDDSPEVTWAGGWGILGTGEITRFMGMTEKGMHFELQLLTDAGDYIPLIMTRETLSSYAFPEGTGSMTLHQIDGPLLSGLPESGSAKLVLPEF